MLQKKLGVSTRRIQQMCKQGEISNAFKDGRTWLIPDDITLKQLKPLPIGVSDFKSATTNYYYVDKTLMIRDFLDAKPMISLHSPEKRNGSSGLTARRSASVERCEMAVTRD